MPPLTNPLNEFSFAQTGASVGDKINPFYKVSIRHDGLDLIASSGEPVHAAADGVVASVVRSRKGLGNVVEIDHGNGYTTVYAHCSKLLVKAGQSVAKGETIARVGSTGRSTGPHLHFEIRVNGQHKNPLNYIG